MTSDTIAPAQPSMFTPVKRAMRVAARTMVVAHTSERLSVAVASTAAELMRLPTARLYSAMYSFTRIEPIRMQMDRMLKSTASGWMILVTEVLARSKPIIRITKDTTRPAMHSKRPWP